MAITHHHETHFDTILLTVHMNLTFDSFTLPFISYHIISPHLVSPHLDKDQSTTIQRYDTVQHGSRCTKKQRNKLTDLTGRRLFLFLFLSLHFLHLFSIDDTATATVPLLLLIFFFSLLVLSLYLTFRFCFLPWFSSSFSFCFLLMQIRRIRYLSCLNRCPYSSLP
jgi:hypothetical protein